MNAPSPYYPPRARWYSGVFTFWAHLVYATRLDKIQFGGSVSLGTLLLSLVIPGYSFRISSRKKLAKQILIASGVGVLAYVVLMGYALGNLCFGLVVGLHATSLIQLIFVVQGGAPLSKRLGFAIGGVVILFVVYRIGLGVVQENWVVPLQWKGHVMVVNRRASPATVERGTLVAYSLRKYRGDGVYFNAGLGFNQVLGVAGDEIVFGRNHLEVNGQIYPRNEMMPQTGRLKVPENSWFIWPAYNIATRGIAPAENIRAGLLHAAIVRENQFVGLSFKSWCGRPQKVP